MRHRLQTRLVTTPSAVPEQSGPRGLQSRAVTGVVLLVDDVRRFRDDRPCVVATNPDDAVSALREHRSGGLDELWLDHDLGRHPDGRARTVMPVVEELVQAAADGGPYPVRRILIHSSNPAGALAIRRGLEGAGYTVERHHAPIWRHDFDT